MNRRELLLGIASAPVVASVSRFAAPAVFPGSAMAACETMGLSSSAAVFAAIEPMVRRYWGLEAGVGPMIFGGPYDDLDAPE